MHKFFKCYFIFHRYDIGESAQLTSMCGRDLEIDGFTVSDGGNVYSIEDVEIRDLIHTNCHYDFFSTKVRLKKVRVLRSAILLKQLGQNLI